MRQIIAHLWQSHRPAVLLFLAALAVMVFFALRFLWAVFYWANPLHLHQPPAPWMTPRYGAHSWQVPPQQVAEALQIPPGLPARPTLQDIAKARDLPVDVLLAQLQARLQAMQGGAEN